MSDDPRLSLRAQLALDDELDTADRLAFEDELAHSPELAAEYERLGALRRSIRAHAPREAAPESLRARIAALGEPQEAPAAPPAPVQPAKAPARAWRFPRADAAALAAGFAMFAALGGFWAGRAGTGSESDVAALVAGYQRAALSGQAIDVASSDRHTVKPWLASRAPLGSAAPDLASDGYPLVGGRIDIVDRRPVPTLVYRRREHLISVSELPRAEIGDGATTLDGYHVERWRDGERSYVVVSDMDAGELGDFIALFRKRATP